MSFGLKLRNFYHIRYKRPSHPVIFFRQKLEAPPTIKTLNNKKIQLTRPVVRSLSES